ncbi:MAG: hypothetical protein EA392_00975 [Cryomorphaceae bacterium]|nr:MAG: hypothetical protein EA392_00975 [Cryomorphaceae bacterium]
MIEGLLDYVAGTKEIKPSKKSGIIMVETKKAQHYHTKTQWILPQRRAFGKVLFWYNESCLNLDFHD